MTEDRADLADGEELRHLSGWKDIAHYLGRGTRTVQRWEKEYDLPVRRLSGKGGRSESVFALPEELDQWLQSAAAIRARSTENHHERTGDDSDEDGQPAGHLPPAPEPEPARPAGQRWRTAALASLATLVLLMAAYYGSGFFRQPPAPSAANIPVSVRIDVDTLRALDSDGREVWHYRFPAPLGIARNGPPPRETLAQAIQFQDFDGDGHYEAMVAAGFEPPHREDSGFYLFNPDGSVRWVHRFGGEARFGQEHYDGPFLPYRFFVTRPPGDGSHHALWVVSIHGQMFPTVLQSVDFRTGQASGEYWSNGYIDIVQSTRIGGRPVLLVGACNNESKGASLAMLDAISYAGAAPAVDPRYTCTTCPAGTPLRFIVFPKPTRFRALDESSSVVRLDVQSSRIVAGVRHASSPGGAASATAFYRMTPEFTPVGADTGDGYLATWAALTRAFLVPPGPPDSVDAEREFFPLQQWNGAAFVPLPLSRPR